MVVQDQDPDVFRWGLHHLLQGAAALVYASAPQSPTPTAPAHRRHQKDASVDSDQVIARILQEELSQIAMAEASGASYATHHHATVLSQRWSSPPIVHVAPAPSAPPLEEAESREGEPFSSCSSPGDDTQDCLIHLFDGSSALDGEVGKRLNDMLPVPHVPKTNGDVPSVDEAFSDHQRLLDRLLLYDLVELKVKGDGNCQFRALSDQFYRTPDHHRFVRQQVVQQLESHPEIYAGYVPLDYREYLKKMSKSGEWGDHVTLQAAADSYGVKIFVLTSFRDTCYIEILPIVEKSKRVICLSFWAEVHYNSIYPEGELPAEENKKKRWWHL